MVPHNHENGAACTHPGLQTYCMHGVKNKRGKNSSTKLGQAGWWPAGGCPAAYRAASKIDDAPVLLPGGSLYVQAQSEMHE